MGKDEKTLLDISQRQNMPIPDRILNAPVLREGMQWYVDVFNVLSPSRPSSQGYVARIPYPAFSMYCTDEGIDGPQREDMFYLITAMDNHFVNWHFEQFRKKSEADANKAKAPPTAPRRR